MYQQLTIVGNLGRDPEMRYTADGTPVTDFSVAVNKKWSGGEKTWWFKVTCWKRLAETTNQYLKKGSQVLVVGEIDADAYTDKQGNVRASLNLTARDVKFMSGGTQGGGGGGSASSSSSSSGYDPGSYAQQEEELPF